MVAGLAHHICWARGRVYEHERFDVRRREAQASREGDRVLQRELCLGPRNRAGLHELLLQPAHGEDELLVAHRCPRERAHEGLESSVLPLVFRSLGRLFGRQLDVLELHDDRRGDVLGLDRYGTGEIHATELLKVRLARDLDVAVSDDDVLPEVMLQFTIFTL